MKPAIIGVLIGALLLSGCAGSVSGSTAEQPASETTGVEGVVSKSVMELTLGACVNDAKAPEGADAEALAVVDCATPHDSELYAILALENSSFPGEQALLDEGSTRCAAVFGDFIGVDFRSSVLDFNFYHPTASSWVDGDRSIYCMAIDPGLQVTGSLLGAKR